MLARDHPLYRTWQGMRDRCTKTRNDRYASYGGRGITVCPRWDKSFWNFVKDMGPKPTPKHTLDRIDNDGPYSPENCRWATPQQQAFNRRLVPTNTSGHHGVTFDKRFNKWVARIHTNKKNHYLGSFEKMEDAVAARKEAEVKFLGSVL